MATCTANGITLDYEILGRRSDPAIVLIRGTGSQRVRWPRALLDGLVNHGLCVVTFDNRDTGGSSHFEHHATPSLGEVMARVASGEPVAAPYTLSDMAEDVRGLMDALQLDRALLLGLSMGGLIAQTFALTHPDRLRGLVLLMSAPSPPQMAWVAPTLMQALARGPKGADEEALIAFAIEVATLSTGALFPIDAQEVRDVWRLERQRGVAQGGETRQVMAMYASEDRPQRWAGIDVPTLIIHGTDDPMLPFAQAQALAALIPQSRLLAIDGAGHEITPTLVPRLVAATAAFHAELPQNSMMAPAASRG